MRNPGGYLRVEDGSGGVRECDTFSCVHCNKVVKVPASAPLDTLGKFCARCCGMTCRACATLDCRPFERWLDQVEGREGRRATEATREAIDTRLRLEAHRRASGLGA